jgi:DNA-binding transcriptional MocR family regulator
MGTIIRFTKDDFFQVCTKLPKYKALVLLIEQAIHSKELHNKQKLPPQRILADQLGITHGTVTRAYELLEKKGLVEAKLGAGTYVNAPTTASLAASLVKEYDFASSMQPMLGQQVLVKDALNDLADDLGSIEEVMTYAPQGIQKHKKKVSLWLATKKVEVSATDIIFTQGAQQGIYTCLNLLSKESDYILHEELAYPGFFRAAEANRLKTLEIPLTNEGLDLTILEQYCQKFKPKLLYITPNIQNPTNIKYSKKQLDEILKLSLKYQFYIIEDDVNYCLPENWSVPLQQRSPDRVFYLSSLSKYVAGGLRVAYALVPKIWQQAFNLSIHSQCWMVSTLSTEIATRFLMEKTFLYNQFQLEEEMRYRQQAFKGLSKKYALEARNGGLNVWLTLPSYINANQFNNFLSSKNIRVRVADLFRSPTSSLPSANCLRISLGGFNTRVDFNEGLEKFEQALIEFNNQQDVVI